MLTETTKDKYIHVSIYATVVLNLIKGNNLTCKVVRNNPQILADGVDTI